MEETSFEEFYEREYHAVLTFARVMSTSRQHAEDLAHEAFASAWQSWDSIDTPGAWTRRVVANKARSAMRRRYAERRAVDRLSTESSVVIGSDLPAETDEFWATVRSLPMRQAQAIALFYLEDRSIADIASILDCAPSTARVHLTRGRKTLAKRLGATR